MLRPNLRESPDGLILSFAMADRTHGEQHRRVGRDVEERAEQVGLAGRRRPEFLVVDEVRDGDDLGRPIPRHHAMPTGHIFGDGDQQIVETGVDLGMVSMQVRDALDAVPLPEQGAEIAGARQMGVHQRDAALTAPVRHPVAFVERPAVEVRPDDGQVGGQVAPHPRVFLARQQHLVTGLVEQHEAAPGEDGRPVRTEIGRRDEDAHGSA